MDHETGLIIVQTAEGYSITLGQYKCARLWLCPVCSANIRQARAEETVRALVAWIEQGGTALLVTLTARHTAAHRLEDLMDAIQGTRKAARVDIDAARAELAEAKAELIEASDRARRAVEIARLAAPKGSKRAAMAEARKAGAAFVAKAEARAVKAKTKVRALDRQAGAYQRLITGGSWAGRPERGEPGLRDLIGYLGMMRSTEVTVSIVNGWHPHLHLIVLLGARTAGAGADRQITGVFEVPDEAMDAFEQHVRKVWTGTLRRINPEIEPSLTCYEPGCKCGGKGHAVDIQRIHTVKDAKAQGEYVVKTQDGKNPAYELTRGDNKDGRFEGQMVPFQLLEGIGEILGGVVLDEGAPDLDWFMDRWAEYEPAVSGRRAMEWTRYLRQMLGIEGGDSQLDDADLQFEQEGLSEFRAGVQIEAEAWPKVTARALDLAALEAVEGTGGIDLAKVEAVIVEQAGAPADSVRLLSPGEVAEAWDHVLAKLAKRREEAAARRREEETDGSSEGQPAAPPPPEPAGTGGNSSRGRKRPRGGAGGAPDQRPAPAEVGGLA